MREPYISELDLLQQCLRLPFALMLYKMHQLIEILQHLAIFFTSLLYQSQAIALHQQLIELPMVLLKQLHLQVRHDSALRNYYHQLHLQQNHPSQATCCTQFVLHQPEYQPAEQLQQSPESLKLQIHLFISLSFQLIHPKSSKPIALLLFPQHKDQKQYCRMLSFQTCMEIQLKGKRNREQRQEYKVGLQQLIHQEFQHQLEQVNFRDRKGVYFVEFYILIPSFQCTQSVRSQEKAHAIREQMVSWIWAFHLRISSQMTSLLGYSQVNNYN